jgi:hypothetical protein
MAELAAMTPEMAERFLAEQPYPDRIHVSLVGKHGGFQPVPVLSAAEFVKVTTGLNPVFASDALAKWVTGQLGDSALAEAILAECADKPLFEQTAIASGLVAERIAQAESVLETEPAL